MLQYLHFFLSLSSTSLLFHLKTFSTILQSLIISLEGLFNKPSSKKGYKRQHGGFRVIDKRTPAFALLVCTFKSWTKHYHVHINSIHFLNALEIPTHSLKIPTILLLTLHRFPNSRGFRCLTCIILAMPFSLYSVSIVSLSHCKRIA